MKEMIHDRVSRRLIFIQALLGFGATLFFALPYLRRTHGLDRLRPSQKYLFVANHVSLLDTILLGGLCWRSGCYPILTLGDKNVWHASWLKKILSSKIGFLVERGKLNPGRIRELQEFGRAGKKFHPLGGLQKIEVHFGEPILPEKYAALPRAEFLELMQRSIATARQPQPAVITAEIPNQAARLG